MNAIDKDALLTELQQAFDVKTAEVLANVLDRMAAQLRASGVTREDFGELKQVISELAQAQQRTEEGLTRLEAAVERLAQAQQRTQEQVDELAKAQQRTEERLTRLEAAVERLAQAQQRTEERLTRLEAAVEKLTIAVSDLTEGMDRLRKQVGGLSETVGGDIEDIAYIVLHDVLRREFGWKVGLLERSWQKWNDEPEEVNVFGIATDPNKPEKTIWIVGEAKHNLAVREVERFAAQVERAKRHLEGEIFPVCFCYRARPEVQQKVQDAGLRLVFSYGKLL